jgi:hypothetical protein
MKLKLNEADCEVYDEKGNTIVVLDGETFEFEFPELEAEIVAFTEEGPLFLAEDELELLAEYRGESIQLAGNPYHDNKGQFAAKSGGGGVTPNKSQSSFAKGKSTFAKETGARLGKSAVQGAAGGAFTGAIGGAFSEVFKGGESGVKEGSALARAKRGAIKGAIRGAKRGAIKAVIRESFGIGSELAGNYGWAVKSIGGLSISMASRKMNFGLSEKDLSGISREMFSGGFADLAAKLEWDNEVILLDESKFSRGLAELAYAIADALEENPDTEGIGFENTPELGSLGFQEEEGIWYIDREKAEELLAGLTSYAEVKLENANEVVRLFNPTHDELGRFASKTGNAIKTKYNSLTPRQKSVLIRSAVLAGVTVIAAGAAAYSGYSQRKKFDIAEVISNDIDFAFAGVGKQKVDPQKIKQFETHLNDLTEQLGVKPKVKRVVFTDDFAMTAVQTDKNDFQFHEFDKSMNQKKFNLADDMKLGALVVWEKLSGGVYGLNWGNTNEQGERESIGYYSIRRLNEHTIKHELIHGIGVQKKMSTLKREGLTDALTSIVTKQKIGSLDGYAGLRQVALNKAKKEAAVVGTTPAKILMTELGLNIEGVKLETSWLNEDELKLLLTEEQSDKLAIEYYLRGFDANEDEIFDIIMKYLGEQNATEERDN